MYRKIPYAIVVGFLLLSSCRFYKNSRNNYCDAKQYVIIGCSAAGYHAARELVRLDEKARVICVSEEQSTMYNKTALHSFVSGKKSGSSVELVKGENAQAIRFIFGKKVIQIDRHGKKVIMSSGESLGYDKLLVATGASPNVPEHLAHTLSLNGVYFYNTLLDVKGILARIQEDPKARVLVVGASIRALELIDGLKKRSKTLDITLVNRSTRFFGESGDSKVDEMIASRLRSWGVKISAPMAIREINQSQEGMVSVLSNGDVLVTDIVVFAIGTSPNSQLAERANLATYDDGSIRVDEELRTNDDNIFAAGDVVGLKNPIGEGIVRSSKWRSAKIQGKIAAANMTGQKKHYRHEPAAYATSFLGMKTFVSGNIRSKPKIISLIKENKEYYHRLVTDKQLLKAFVVLWDESSTRPNIFSIRSALVDQTPIDALRL